MMFLGPNLAELPASLVKSPQPLPTAWRISLCNRIPAGEDALVRVKPICNVRKLRLPIKEYEGY
jgi:hypothetical protein